LPDRFSPAYASTGVRLAAHENSHL